jgi:hypothetical protein
MKKVNENEREITKKKLEFMNLHTWQCRMKNSVFFDKFLGNF